MISFIYIIIIIAELVLAELVYVYAIGNLWWSKPMFLRFKLGLLCKNNDLQEWVKFNNEFKIMSKKYRHHVSYLSYVTSKCTFEQRIDATGWLVEYYHMAFNKWQTPTQYNFCKKQEKMWVDKSHQDKFTMQFCMEIKSKITRVS